MYVLLKTTMARIDIEPPTLEERVHNNYRWIKFILTNIIVFDNYLLSLRPCLPCWNKKPCNLIVIPFIDQRKWAWIVGPLNCPLVSTLFSTIILHYLFIAHFESSSNFLSILVSLGQKTSPYIYFTIFLNFYCDFSCRWVLTVHYYIILWTVYVQFVLPSSY